MSVTQLFHVVEGDSSPLAIPPRPMRVSDAGSRVQSRQMSGRVYTFEIYDDTGIVGYLRWHDDGTWVARTRGGEKEPPAIRRFIDRGRAAAWLQQRLTGRAR
jgi:hypothetical protein